MEKNIVKIKSGIYALIINNKMYAIMHKGKDGTCWRYEDSTKIYWFKTLKQCKEHISLINWNDRITTARKRPIYNGYGYEV